MGIDFIGDIHGYADRLVALLSRLGYKEARGAWRHPDRTVMFLGDLIDRGPEQIRVLSIVRAMIEAGSARAVMGNHEYNAIAYATEHPEHPGYFLRRRDGEKGLRNRQQHEAFLSAVGEDSKTHFEWIEWFSTLPLWIEEPSFQVVHACWSPEHIQHLRENADQGNLMSRVILVEGNNKGHPIYKSVETVLKGMEARLPDGVSFRDKEGFERTEIRTRWWDPSLKTYHSAYIGPPGAELPDIPITQQGRVEAPDKPTFIGHYWLDPTKPVAPLTHNVACLDYSVANGGPLTAYRFDGEPTLNADNFVSV